MRVSAKSDYALRALIELAARPEGAAVTAEELGRLQAIPHGFLQSILAVLRRAGLVRSQRGQAGGWCWPAPRMPSRSRMSSGRSTGRW
jgi:Rrf2 family protein